MVRPIAISSGSGDDDYELGHGRQIAAGCDDYRGPRPALLSAHSGVELHPDHVSWAEIGHRPRASASTAAQSSVSSRQLSRSSSEDSR